MSSRLSAIPIGERVERSTIGLRVQLSLSFYMETVDRPMWGNAHRSADYYRNPAPDDLMRATMVYAYVLGLWIGGRCTMGDASDLASERDRSLGGTGCHRAIDRIVSSIY